MANSNSAEDFEIACNLAMNLLKQTHPRDGKAQEEI